MSDWRRTGAALALAWLAAGGAEAAEARSALLTSEYQWYVLGAVALAGAQTLLIAGLLIESRRQRRVERGLDEHRRFEILLADLAAASIETPAREIDERIRDGLGRTIEELGLDRASVAELDAAGNELRMTHGRSRSGVAPTPGVLTAEACPWTLDRLRHGRNVCVARLTDLPREAATDRQSFAALFTSSIVILPLVVEGVVVGAFACSMQRERDWPDDLVHRLGLLADIFAVVLMRRRADKAHEDSESRLHQMADAAPVMMWVAGPDGGRVDFNRTWLRFTGRTLADEVGDGWLEDVHPEDRESCLARYRAAVTARRPFAIECRLRRSDGCYRSVLDNGVPSVDSDRGFPRYVGSAVDITEVKLAQQALVESLALRSAIVGSLGGPVAAVDRTGGIVAVNESWTRVMAEMGGDASTASVGANYLDVCRRAALVGDPHARAALDAIHGVLAGGSARELLEYPCVTPSGVQWYAMIVEPFKHPGGGVVISHIDITRRRRAEEEVQRDRDELAHALRLATLGELATSVAHEINQPLAAIASNAQAARRLIEPAQAGGEIPAVLQDIAADAQRAAQVIRRLRALFKKEHGERHAVDMTAVIKEVVSLLGKDLERRRICLELALPPDTSRVLGDVVQLQQVILNVLLNAAEAMTDAAHPRVLRIETNGRESGILTITVRDSGSGAEASELEHIFERFVTKKVDGLGMGLSISRSIVKAHGGRMWATRNTGRGLTMHIELPSLEREPEHPAR